MKEDNHDVRYNAYKTIITMINELSSELILNIQSRKMDEENSYIKFLIIEHWLEFWEYNKGVSQAILDKAIVDNNYVVRKRATAITSSVNQC